MALYWHPHQIREYGMGGRGTRLLPRFGFNFSTGRIQMGMLTKVPDNSANVSDNLANDSIFQSNEDYWSASNSFKYWSLSKWNIESLAKLSGINYTGFECNNMAKFCDYQILANRFVLKLKECKNFCY